MAIFAKDVFSVTTVQFVTSREREILALGRHIRRFFLHVQIAAKMIFISE